MISAVSGIEDYPLFCGLMLLGKAKLNIPMGTPQSQVEGVGFRVQGLGFIPWDLRPPPSNSDYKG